ncbi:hypothetical protein MKW94_015092 [Papaver nudicaule]|uniref:F-box domain-containing protein n=1 Tax=Papaver nudicaule TaxID=74823 RepID=A0AA42AZB4_PAPNU|nr:hypothetical protein [Papaver nudicaule]
MSALPILDENTVHYILINLPLKSLMRFKCVSKSWQSLIQDSYFVDLHLTRSKKHPQLLINTYDNDSINFLSPENAFKGGVAHHKVSIPRCERGGGLLKPIDGLFCCFDGKLMGATRIINLSTRQVTPWAQTSVNVGIRRQISPFAHTPPFVKDPSVTQRPIYGFGFDPCTKKYKVLCVWVISRPTFTYGRNRMMVTEGEVEHICEVLTVGENRWRKIDEVPPVLKLDGHAVYANGSIYTRNAGGIFTFPPEAEFIVAFDVGIEKFRLIEIPDFIIDSPGRFSRPPYLYLLQIDGHIALVDIINEHGAYESEHVVRLWISDDSYNEKKMKANWTEETILLPFSTVRDKILYPVDGTHEIVIKKYTSRSFSEASLYIYDRIMKSFREIDITGISPISPGGYSMFIFHESTLSIGNPAEEEQNQTIDDWFKEGRHYIHRRIGHLY